MLKPITSIPTHLITGFLGAGKTTLLQQLLAQKPSGETWAVLMNEFGEIGLDQHWVSGQDIVVRELLGGCLCCTSQLPMQIALARLLTEKRPQRLFIEPTGLGHPDHLIQQLQESHWQSSLSLRSVITVLDVSRLHQQLERQHAVYLQQLEVTDIIVMSHTDQMQEADHQHLIKLRHRLDNVHQQWVTGPITLAQIDQVHQPPIEPVRMPLLTRRDLSGMSQSIVGDEGSAVIRTLPYHYTDQREGYYLAGWKLPARWQFDLDAIYGALNALAEIERIKAQLWTTEGWVRLNGVNNHVELDYMTETAADNRLEIIANQSQDWTALEQQVLAARLNR